MDEVRAERDDANAEAAESNDPADGPPIPTVEAITSDGKMKIKFSCKLQVPAQEEIDGFREKEVAFRSTQARTETYLTENGYQDFEIRP